MLQAMLGVSLALGLSIAQADEGTPNQVLSALKVASQHTTYPFPMPDASDLKRLEAGRVVKKRIKATSDGGHDRAMGLVLSDEPLQQLWLASLDPHFGAVTSLTVHFLETPPGSIHRWYGFVDLPFPFTDRHFLINTFLNLKMHAATDGKFWERAWKLEEDGPKTMGPMVAQGQVDGVTQTMFDNAIYTPANFGSWTFLELGDGQTLVVYNACTVVGGDIPDSLVTQHMLMGVDELLNTVVDRAATMPQHYVAGHEPLLGGDGKSVPFR